MLNDKVKIIRNNYRTKVLFEEYHIDGIWQYGFMIFFCGQRVIYAAVLAKLYNHPDMQVFIMAAVSAVVTSW